LIEDENTFFRKSIMKYRWYIFLSILLFSGCKGGNKEQQAIQKLQPIADSTYIFNGATLDGWEVTNFGPQGPVYVSGNEVVLGAGDGCTGITYKKSFPENNYKVTLEAKRVSGTDFFCGMTFPVEKEPCTLILGGWGGSVVGLSSIDGMDASENETTRSMKFDNERWYDICLVVKGDSIKAWVDDSLVVDFNRDDKNLSIRPEVNLSRPFGFASWRTTAALRNIRLTGIK
jgi:hypothetical protein